MRHFRTLQGRRIKLPIFFPDATRAVIKGVDVNDIKSTNTPGILVNTYHLMNDPGEKVISHFNGIKNFMGYDHAVISDSGGFQIMSLVKAANNQSAVNDLGVNFRLSRKKNFLLTPEKSIKFQISLKTDLTVVLDDFTPSDANKKTARTTVERTINWARRSKDIFEECYGKGNSISKPYLIAVVQGGRFFDLRQECKERLMEIGFDGLGYGGWPVNKQGKFDLKNAEIIADKVNGKYLLYGLGVGKPEDIVACAKLGFNIFDCVLPTRDARHGRLYVFNEKNHRKVDLEAKNFYSFLYPGKEKYRSDNKPVSEMCDCSLCKNYSLAYLTHLYKINDFSAMRLSTIHNLRFYSILMEKLQSTLSGK